MSLKASEKLIEQISGLTVLELAELVKSLEEKFGVSASAGAMSAAPAAQAASAPAAQEEKSEYKVELISVDNKINAIKAIRSVSPMSLTDAKNAVENLPSVIAEAASKDDSKKIKEALEAAGAKVKLS